jgi:carboxypeptidase C (cathepsin A)
MMYVRFFSAVVVFVFAEGTQKCYSTDSCSSGDVESDDNSAVQVRAHVAHKAQEFVAKAKIEAWPGLPTSMQDMYTMFSGYIPVTPDGSRRLHYVFVESSGSPETDPVLWWTNGGPGCSGLEGFLTGMGPFRPDATGGLTINPHAWTKFASAIFIEQPAGVGFSHVAEESSVNYSDTTAAKDNWIFITEFFKLYPEFRSNDFYLTSESYGGHYLPELAREILHKNNGEVNFKGFAVGNPVTWMTYINYGLYAKWWGAGLLPKPQYDMFMEKACYMLSSSAENIVVDQGFDEECWNLTDYFDDLMADVDPYALMFPTCSPQTDALFRHHPLMRNITAKLRASFKYEPCWEDLETAYFNRPDVQNALHIANGPVKWTACSDYVGDNWDMEEQYAPMMPVYKELIENGTLRIMVYSGDDDSICSTQASQQWIWNMGYDNTETWAPYMVDDQVGGMTTYFTASNGAGFRFTSVHGAGHMVPSTQPKRGVYIMKKFLSGEW